MCIRDSNYIERQYEQYEARKAAWEKKCKQGKKKTISVKLQPKDLTDNTIKLPRKAFITGCLLYTSNLFVPIKMLKR